MGLLGASVLGVAILRRVRGSGRRTHRDGARSQQCGSDKSLQVADDGVALVPTKPTATSVAATVDTTLPPASQGCELPSCEEVSVADSPETEQDQPEGSPDRAHAHVAVATGSTTRAEEFGAEDAQPAATDHLRVQGSEAGDDANGEKTWDDRLDSGGIPAISRRGASPEELESETPRDAVTTTDAVPLPQKLSVPKPRKYEGLARRPPRPAGSDRHGPRVTADAPVKQEHALPIEVRLRFDRGGFCSVSLIASRSPGLPEDVTVAAASGRLDLCAMQDEWYQDVVPEEIPQLLREGVVWSQEGETGTRRWSLSGRELFVLAERPDLSGWVSQPCLKLGRKHAVLCTEQLRPAAEEVLRATGVESAVVLDASLGVPTGWVIIQDVVPIRPVAPAGDAEILNALRPRPEVEIGLEGGIRLEYATWLEGYPPLVRVYGDAGDTTEVRIDGCTAPRSGDGAYRLPGWDAAGKHTVWCEGISKSYSIVPFAARWESWDAYSFPVASGSSRRLSICGPLVHEASTSQQGWTPAIQLPETNTVVLGAAPGEHAVATRASGIRGTPYLASPPFHPVWALPPDPMHCSKMTARILLLAEHAKPAIRAAVPRATRGRADVDTWCRLILDVSRKGLATEPDTERVRALWLLQKRAARRIWRSVRK